MIELGLRYFKFNEDDSLEVVQVTKIKSEVVRVYDMNTHVYRFIKIEQLEKEYTGIVPDGFVVFSIINMTANTKDIVIETYRASDVDNGIQIPYQVCRQNMIDIFYQMTGHTDTMVGCSITVDSIPEGMPFNDIVSAQYNNVKNGIVKQYMIALYYDDKLEDLLRPLPSKHFDNELEYLFADHAKNVAPGKEVLNKIMGLRDFHGYNRTIKELLEYTNFMYDVRRGFGILSINEAFEYDESSGIIDENIIHIIETVNSIKFTKPIAIKYSKDIDLSKLDNRHMLVCDGNEDVYLIAYNRIEKHHVTQSEERDVIMQSLGLNMSKYR